MTNAAAVAEGGLYSVHSDLSILVVVKPVVVVKSVVRKCVVRLVGKTSSGIQLQQSHEVACQAKVQALHQHTKLA